MPGSFVQNVHPMWTAERLRTLLEGEYSGERVLVLANRQPCRHERTADGRVVLKRSASGVVTALEPLVQSCDGVWIAHGCGDADRSVVDDRDGLDIPCAEHSYRLRRVWLSDAEHRGYYEGFSNEGLWPLCHGVHVRPIFRPRDFTMYRLANMRFAQAAVDEADGNAPLVLVQDYHLALAPRMVRQAMPSSTIVAFWHVPWPRPHEFAVCPWGPDLVDGLLASDILGFQTASDCQRFLDTLAGIGGVDVDDDEQAIVCGGHRTLVRAYPVSVEYPNRWVRAAASVERCRAAVLQQLGLPPDVRLAVGVDRLDYTKGIPEKFLAIERLLSIEPALRDSFAFVQVAEPSRESLPAYRENRTRVLEVMGRVNRRFARGGRQPIVLLERHHEPSEVYQLLRAADLCYVGSLQDGMNLVAKEFVAARNDGRGVLVLSSHAGAAGQLAGGAMLIDPHDVDGTAGVLARALAMDRGEQARRMRAMRSVVARFNSYWWVGRMLEDAAQLRDGQPRAQGAGLERYASA
jgi:trehalose 6-phosphate synthase